MGQFAFLFGLHLIGTLFGLLFKRRLPLPFLCVTGFFWGAVLWVIVALLLMTLSLPYTLASMLIVLVVVAAILIWLHIRQGTLQLTVQELSWLVGSLLGVAIAILAAVNTNYTRATADSFALITLGRNYAQDGFNAWSLSRLSDWGVFLPVLLSASVFVGLDYLNALLPTISLFYFLSFFVLIYLAVRKVLDNITPAVVVSVAGGLLLSTTYIAAFQIFYVHTNQSSAAYLFLAVAAFWFAASEKNNTWLIFGSLALLGFSLMRTEGPLFAVIPLVLFLSDGEENYKERLLVALPLTGLLLLWYVRIAFSVSVGDGLITPTTTLVMIAPMVGVAGFAVLTYFRFANRLMKQLGPLMVVILLFACVVFFLIIPEHMIDSLVNLLTNLFMPSRWGFTWFIVLTLLPVFFIDADLPSEKLLSIIAPASLLLILVTAYPRYPDIGPFHDRFYDSANRMTTHILPVMIFYGGLKLASINWRSERHANRSYRFVLIVVSLVTVGFLLHIVAKFCPIQAEHLRYLYRAYRLFTVGVLGIFAAALTVMVIDERAARLGYTTLIILLVLSGIVVNIRNLSFWHAFERLPSDELVDLAATNDRPNWELFEAVYDQYRGNTLLTGLNIYEEIESWDNKFVWWGGFQRVEYPADAVDLSGEQVESLSELPSTEELINTRSYVLITPTGATTDIWFVEYGGKYYFVPADLLDD